MAGNLVLYMTTRKRNIINLDHTVATGLATELRTGMLTCFPHTWTRPRTAESIMHHAVLRTAQQHIDAVLCAQEAYFAITVAAH